MAQIILKPESKIHQLFQQLIKDADRVFFAGLPGVGKSLLLQQLTLMAQQAGRSVHHLQWDTTRLVFQTPEIVAKYPRKIDGVHHAMTRKAVGLWARQGVAEWDKSHDKPAHMLIGEVPLIGNRLTELVKPHDDDIEATLHDDRTQFVIPVPSKTVRDVIEASRERTFANPQHEKETDDAPPNVLRRIWYDLNRLSIQLSLATGDPGQVPYSPDVYHGVYQYLLRHRNVKVLEIDEILKPVGSAYDLDQPVPDLHATAEQVTDIMARLERDFTVEQVEADVENWYRV